MSSKSIAQPDINSSEFLEYLEHALDGPVVLQKPMSPAEYMAILSAINASQQDSGYEIMENSVFTIVQHSRALYFWLINYAVRVFSGIYNGAAVLQGESLLTYYLKQWKHFQWPCHLLSNSFASIGKQWIEGEWNTNYMCVAETLVQLWYRYLFKPISTRLVSSAITLINSERSSGVIDSMLIVKLYKSFMELRPLNMPEIHVNYREYFGVYIRYYEMPYIDAVVRYIDSNIHNLRTANKLRQYIEKLHTLVLQEEQHAKQYLCPESLVPLQTHINNEFLIRYIEPINNLVTQMVMDDPDGLRISYALLQRFEKYSVLQHLQTEFVSNARDSILLNCPKFPEDGRASMSEFTLNAIAYLSDHYELGKATINTLFNGNLIFDKAFEHMFKELINSNKVENWFKVNPARLAAEYCNLVLKSRTTTELNFTDMLKKAMNVFKASSNRTMFYSFYSLHLSRRLINSTIITMDFERTAISIIYETALSIENEGEVSIAGLAAINFDKHKQMISEISAQQPHVELENCQASARVLSEEVWDSVKPDADRNIVLPKQLSKACDQFSTHFNNRVIKWQWRHTTATAQVHFPQSKSKYAMFTFVLNAFQVAILSLFTEPMAASDDPVYTIQQINKETNISVERIDAELNIMTKAKILIRTQDGIKLNQYYNSKHQRIDISRIKAIIKRREEQKLECEVAENQIKYVTADIVHLMKSFKTISHNELFERVGSRRGNYFTVTMPLFKAAISKLLDKEYICRNSDDLNVYEYLA
ncbi:ubiquitin ligase (cullin) of SCF [Coemansia sp. RSA 1290]|nr:ubiquitin ligase (cullin) of SCF [Coemansia sp. RSA 1290]